MEKKLRDVLPPEVIDWGESINNKSTNSKFMKYLDCKILETILEYDSRFPFIHKHIFMWWILENNIAIGWNEDPSEGWSFPVVGLKGNK